MTHEILPLADTHCHLTLSDFAADRPQVLARARAAGVAWMVVPGIDMETSRAAVRFAETEPGVFAAVGVHPHHAAEWNPSSRAALRDLARAESVVAIGEIGLDYYRRLSPPSAQRQALVDQLLLAQELGLPVILHNRQAMDDLLPLLEHWASADNFSTTERGVLHAFSADLPSAERALAAGFYLGIAGPITYPRATSLRALVQQVPLDRIVVETDSPYLPPQPYRGTRNEPCHTKRVAEEVAQLLSLPYPAVAEATSTNAAALFGWPYDPNHHHLL